MRAALATGRLTPLKVIHLSRILDSSMSVEKEAEAIDAATRLSVRELEALAKKESNMAAGGDDDAGTEVPDPWKDKPGTWIEFSGSPRVFFLFRAAIEAARRFAGEELPRQACLEYMAADRLSAVGAPPDLDRPELKEEGEANPEPETNPAPAASKSGVSALLPAPLFAPSRTGRRHPRDRDPG